MDRFDNISRSLDNGPDLPLLRRLPKTSRKPKICPRRAFPRLSSYVKNPQAAMDSHYLTVLDGGLFRIDFGLSINLVRFARRLLVRLTFHPWIDDNLV